MSTRLDFYDYNQTFYTGIDTQPDVFHMFVKPEKGNKKFIMHNAMPLANWLGFFPVVSFFSGAARVSNAVKVIFKELSHLKLLSEEAHKKELWNAFKNLFRGIVEMIPLTGIALIIFESARNAFYCGKIIKELSEQENISGVAIDGKIIITIDLGKVDKIIDGHQPEKLNEFRLAVFRDLCQKMLKRVEEKKQKIGMNELFSKLANLA